MSGTVVDRVREQAETRGFLGNVALVESDRTFTYEALFARVDSLSAAFAALGLGLGDGVLAFLPNVHEAVECELAALQSGLAWITLTARLTWSEVRGVVVACAPRLIVTNPEGAARIAAGLVALPLGALPRLLVTRSGAEGALGYEEAIAGQVPRRPSLVVGPEHVARLRYTSGTTGGAKAAVLPHRVYHASLDNLLHELHPVTEADRALHVAPLTHGSGALLYPVFHAGGAHVLEGAFDAGSMLEAIEHHRVTLMFTVPTMLSRLVTDGSFEARDLSSLRALIYGGAPMPEAQLETAVRKVGRALFQIYGMTEAPWPITLLRPEDHRPGSPRLRSVGRPTTVCEVRIGEAGEIQLRGRNVMQGYLDDPAGTAAVLGDGWLSTGDVGRLDEDGYLFIVGREKDVIISGGFNVYAAEVEAALSAHPGVLEVAVVGLPDADWGERVTAVVVPRPGVTLSAGEVNDVARGRLSGYKCPRQIEIVQDLPKNASGKIQKSEIIGRLGAPRP